MSPKTVQRFWANDMHKSLERFTVSRKRRTAPSLCF